MANLMIIAFLPLIDMVNVMIIAFLPFIDIWQT
jgi:hypothetical protein